MAEALGLLLPDPAKYAPGGKMTTTTINSPKATRCQPNRKVQKFSWVKWKTRAPITGPQIVPLPPRIAISTIQIPKVAPANAVSVGSMNPIKLPTPPPIRPRKNTETDHETVL